MVLYLFECMARLFCVVKGTLRVHFCLSWYIMLFREGHIKGIINFFIFAEANYDEATMAQQREIEKHVSMKENME